MGVILVGNVGIGAEDRQQNRLGHSGFGAMAGEGVAQRMKTVLGHLALASRDGHGRFDADPADYPQDVEVDQIVADVPAFLVKMIVASSRPGADIVVAVPLQGFLQKIQEAVGDRDGHFLAGLELLHLDAPPLQVDVAPLKENAILEPLPGVHAEIIDHPDFRLVDDLVRIIVQHVAKPLLLFPGESQPSDAETLFFALLAEENRPERIFVVAEFGQGREDFAQPFDFAVVGVYRQSALLQVAGELLRVATGDLADRQPGLVEEIDEFLQRGAILNLFVDRGRSRPFPDGWNSIPRYPPAAIRGPAGPTPWPVAHGRR